MSMNNVARLKDIDNLADQTAQAINYLAQNGGSSSAVSDIVLNTVPATVDGGLWYEVGDGAPVVKIFYGGSAYALGGTSYSGGGGSDTTSGGDTPTLSANVVSYLNFDTDATANMAGTRWAVVGSPTVSASDAFVGKSVHVDHSNYLHGALTLGEQDFTVHFWAKLPEATGVYSVIFLINTNGISPYIEYNDTSGHYFGWRRGISGANDRITTDTHDVGGWRHYAIVYRHSLQELKYYLDGVLMHTVSISLSRGDYDIYFGYDPKYPNDSETFAVDKVMIYDNEALWIGEFTPPTVDDY